MKYIYAEPRPFVTLRCTPDKWPHL